MKRLLMIMTTAAATMSFAAVPAWAQFNNNGGHNVAGTDYIDPANVTGSATTEQPAADGSSAEDSSNGSNMDGDYLVATTPGNGRGQWHSENTDVPHTVRWTFDQNYNLRDMWLWNGNQRAGFTDRGIRDVEVWTSADGSDFSQLMGSYIFTRAPGGTPYNHDMDENSNFCEGCNEVNLFGASLAAVELRMTKPIGESNYGAQSLFVVEEVRFNIGERKSEPLDYTWNVTFGEWTTASPNWTPTGGPPGNPRAVAPANHTATFGSAITSDRTVITETAVSARAITFDNVNTYTIAGNGSVNLIAPTGAGLSTSITGIQGMHQFQAAVNLHTDTTVNIASDSTLIFHNALDLNNNVLNKTGAGELAIRNDLLTSGGTLNCAEGTCSGSGTISGDVNNNGGTISPGNSSGGQSVIPEPTTLLLVMIGAMGLFAFRRGFRREE